MITVCLRANLDQLRACPFQRRRWGYMDTTGIGLIGDTKQASDAYYFSPTFNAAVAGSWFVGTMGIASILCAVVCGFLGGLFGMALQIGLGIYILRSHEVTYHKPLGITMIVSGCLNSIQFLTFLSCIGLSCAIIVHGTQILRVFSKEGRNTRQWAANRRRAMIGVIAAALGLVLWVGVFALGVILYVQTAR
jgi:hypothetical protein